jgi:nitrite reductase/ring-hydroxylating ferredoxin subunit
VARDTGLRLDDLQPGQARVADAGEVRVLLIRLGDDVRATSAWCTHARTLLGDQPVDEDGLIECPLHGAVFDSADGTLQVGPSCAALPVYDVTVATDGAIAVAVPDGEPAAETRRASSFGDWGAAPVARPSNPRNANPTADRS